jgi:hypothetical protein
MPVATAVNADCAPEGVQIFRTPRAYGVTVVGGGISTAASVRARSYRGRPHWWAVLAVTLALMALVAATSTARQLRGPSLPSEVPQRSSEPVLPTVMTSTTLEHTRALHQSGAVVPTTSGSSLTAALKSVATSSTDPTAATVTTTTSSGSGLGTDPNSAGPKVEEGYLQPPNDTSTVYTFTGDGPTTVSVTSPSSTELTLSTGCGGGTQSNEGQSTVEVTLPDAEGACQVTLSETVVTSDNVSYSLTIAPANNE